MSETVKSGVVHRLVAQSSYRVADKHAVSYSLEGSVFWRVDYHGSAGSRACDLRWHGFGSSPRPSPRAQGRATRRIRASTDSSRLVAQSSYRVADKHAVSYSLEGSVFWRVDYHGSAGSRACDLRWHGFGSSPRPSPRAQGRATRRIRASTDSSRLVAQSSYRVADKHAVSYSLEGSVFWRVDYHGSAGSRACDLRWHGFGSSPRPSPRAQGRATRRIRASTDSSRLVAQSSYRVADKHAVSYSLEGSVFWRVDYHAIASSWRHHTRWHDFGSSPRPSPRAQGRATPV